MQGASESVAAEQPAEEHQGTAAEREASPWRKLIEQGDIEEAIKLLVQHLEEAPDNVDALEDLGVAFARRKKFHEAAARFRAAIEVEPTRISPWRNLARAYTDLGQLDNVEECLLKICDLEPGSGANRKMLAEHYKRVRRDNDAVAAMEKAVALEPESADLHHQLGKALAEVKRFGDARKAYARALELSPESADIHNDLGVACQELGRHEDAAKYLREAIRLRPGVVGVYNNLGVALNEQRKFQEAIECYNKALAIGPDYALAWNNLGNSLRAIGRNEAAVAALQTAIRLRPDYPEAFNNIAIAYVQMGENEKALSWYDKALCFRPDYPECHMNRALQRLLVGDFANGWADYEWRWHLKTMRHRDLKKPLWDGTPLGGKKILIYWEQGLGDSIQFIRYAKQLKDRGATVIFEGQPPLQHILARTPGLDQFVPRGSDLPAFDVHAPLLSLPGQCHTTLENIPSDIPYILPDQHFVNLWKPRLDALKGMRVGIVWQGNPDHRGDQLRSIPLRLFEVLAKVEGVTLVSLQKNHGCEQLGELDGLFDVVCFDGVDEEVDGFLRTAAIIKNLDLVICADTSVAHLAGAMGIPVWIVIAVACDWRWLRQREDTPWYPTARLFRQREPANWTEVFERMAAALKERVAASPRRKSQITSEDRKKARDLVRKAAKSLAENHPADSQAQLEQAIAADPDCVDAHHDLGVVHGRQGRVSQAIACFRRAMELAPDSSGAYGNIGLAFLQNGQNPEAIAHLRKAVRLGGGSAEVYNNLGVALMGVPDPSAAEQNYVKALHLQPDFTGAHCNLGRALLLQGKFEQGWLEMEWRWKLSSPTNASHPQPRWTGQGLGGRTVLLWAEEGASAGEIIQYLRYASILKQRGGRVVLECPPRLVRLLSTCSFVDEVVGTESSPPKADVQAALLSMPAIVGTTLHTIPSPGPYLRPDPEAVTKWEARIKSDEGLKVGVCWQGDPQFDLQSDAAIPLEAFRRLREVGGVKLISLQKGRAREQLSKLPGRAAIEDLGKELDYDHLGAFNDTCAVLSQLDLVITSDNTIAHLAGALGVPVWLALPKNHNFRWLMERQDSPWYPTMRIFRQAYAGDWGEVFERVAEDLVERVTASSSTSGSSLTTEVTAQTLHNEACRHLARGELTAAIDRFQQVLEIKPDWPAAHHDLAVAFAKQRKFDGAIEHFRRVLELDPSSQASGNLALALLEKGDLAQAAEEIGKLLERLPDSVELNSRMGIALCRTGKYADAVGHLLNATQHEPEAAEAHYWLGMAYRHEKQFTQAIECLRRAIDLRPKWHDAHNALGLCFAAQGLHEEAVNAFKETVRLNREFPDAWNNLAIALADLSRLDEATEAFQHALYIYPDNAETHRNLAITLLLQGKYDQGWLEYEWRLRAKNAPRRSLPGQRWDGTSLKGKTLLMTSEQGLGDTIQFVRYAKLAKEQGATTIVECQAPLIDLLSRCTFIDRIITSDQAMPKADFHAALMSLPVGFKTRLDNVPAPMPYLTASEDLIKEWETPLRSEARIRLGIVWQGNPGYGGDRHRSIALAQFEPLSQLVGVELFSLQKIHGMDQLDTIAFKVRRLSRFEEASATFDDTAAILKNLDVVVVCDTSVGHLAGALGLPVYLALSTANDWRWMRDRRDTPWYPNTRLFRQKKAGEWEPVFQEIAAAIQVELLEVKR